MAAYPEDTRHIRGFDQRSLLFNREQSTWFIKILASKSISLSKAGMSVNKKAVLSQVEISSLHYGGNRLVVAMQ